MSSDEEETSRAMAEKIQAAVQAEVETVLAQMNLPASSATSTIPPCQHPQPQLYPTRVSCRISVVFFFFSDHPCVGLSLPSQADWRALISPLRDGYLHICKYAPATAATHGTGFFCDLKHGCSS